MVGFSGVMKALYESGVLDCATYVAGLSGSTWSAFVFERCLICILFVSLMCKTAVCNKMSFSNDFPQVHVHAVLAP